MFWMLQAKVFSQPFMLSRLDVKVDDEGSQQAQAAARSVCVIYLVHL